LAAAEEATVNIRRIRTSEKRIMILLHILEILGGQPKQI